jgi:F1F0 ATPase subunit 2
MMSLNEALSLFVVLLLGIPLGVLFYGGLWLTVSRATQFRRPALWFLASMLLRTGVTLAGMYLLADGQWQRLLACLLGIAAGRLAVTRLVVAPTHQLVVLEKDPVHAP